MLSMNRKTLALALSMAIAGSTLVGCSGSQERQAKYLQRAQEYFDKGDFDKARIEAKNVLQINTSNAEGHYLFAQIAEHDRNWPQMFAELNATVEADPKLIKARVKLAQLLTAANQLDKAAIEVDKIQQQEPNNADAFAIRATISLHQKNNDEAIASAQKALQVQPGHVGATGVLTSIYIDSDPAKAEQLLADSIRLNPKNSNLQLLLIKVLGKQNKTAEVESVFKQLVAENPDELIFPTQLANFYIATDRIDDAESLLRKTVESHPKKDDAKLLLVEFLANKRKPEDALKQLEQYSSADPNNYKLRSSLARVYATSGAIDKAITAYQYTIDKEGHNADGIDARNRVIELLLAQNKRPEAEALIKEVLKLEPENTEALLTRARLAMASRDANAAIADLRTVLKNTPDSIPALTLIAAAQESIGASDLALDSYRRVIQLKGDNLSALVNAARLELAQNKIDDAQKLLEHAKEISGTNIDAIRLLVDVYSRKQQWKEALALCDQLQLNSTTAAAGYHLAGLVHMRKQELSEAIDAFKKSLEKEPRAIEPLQMLVTAYASNKQVDVASAYLEKHVKSYPEQVHAQLLLATVYRQTGKLAQAEQVLEEALKKQPKLIPAYRELLSVYSAERRNDKIESLFSRGLQENPDNIDLLAAQAQYFQAIGKDQLALDIYNKLYQLQPSAPIIKNNLAALLTDKFPTDENLRRAQSLTTGFGDSDNPLFIDTLGWLQYKLKNYPQAVSLLESAVKKGGNFPELHYHLGMAYLKNNMASQAKEELAKALSGQTQFAGREEAESTLKTL